MHHGPSSELQDAIDLIRRHSVGKDTILAHINKKEARYLDEHFGGAINPYTGLPTFGIGDSIKNFFKKIPGLGAIIGSIDAAVHHKKYDAKDFFTDIGGGITQGARNLVEGIDRAVKGKTKGMDAFNDIVKGTIAPIADTVSLIPGVGGVVGGATSMLANNFLGPTYNEKQAAMEEARKQQEEAERQQREYEKQQNDIYEQQLAPYKQAYDQQMAPVRAQIDKNQGDLNNLINKMDIGSFQQMTGLGLPQPQMQMPGMMPQMQMPMGMPGMMPSQMMGQMPMQQAMMQAPMQGFSDGGSVQQSKDFKTWFDQQTPNLGAGGKRALFSKIMQQQGQLDPTQNYNNMAIQDYHRALNIPTYKEAVDRMQQQQMGYPQQMMG